MDKSTKVKALKLLKDKKTDSSITYSLIARQTGYSKRQLIRLSKELTEKDMDSVLTHGNTGRKPVTTASAQEISYLREF
jgi:AraC-like DNA-binding protein